MLEVTLVYWPSHNGNSDPVLLARTSKIEIILTVKKQIIAEAEADAKIWRDVDPQVASIRRGEVERMKRLIGALIPDGADFKPEGSEN